MHWDLLIRGARVFDGAGGPGRLLDIAIKDGRIAAKGDAAEGGLPVSAAARVDDATGRWLLPGLLDIHTHEDLAAIGLPQAG